MSIEILPGPTRIHPVLIDRLRAVSFPTIGHYLEEGFMDPGVARQTGAGRIVGRAITVRLTAQDSTLLHHAAGHCEPGDVFVIDTGGDTRHAPVGEVLAATLHSRGAAGVIVDGVITDLDEIEPLGLPVYARGRSMLTTKLLGLDAGGINTPVVCGGVVVRAGDVVLADANGVFAAPAHVLSALITTVEEDDAEEPGLVARIRAGERLGDLTGASATIAALRA